MKRFPLFGLAVASLLLGACAVDTQSDAESISDQSAEVTAFRASAKTNKATYPAATDGTSTLTSNNAQTYLSGCTDFVYEMKDATGTWVAQNPNKACRMPGNARKVGTHSTYDFGVATAGTYRLHYTVGRSCSATKIFSAANCKQIVEVYSPAFTVTAASCDPAVMTSCASPLECVSTNVKTTGKCLPFAHNQPVGLGYRCGGSIGVGCAKGLYCEGIPTPGASIEGGGGTCGFELPCDPSVKDTCGAGNVCIASDLKHMGICTPAGHGQTVGFGDACGGSIGQGCLDGLNCIGMPTAASHLMGGAGLCDTAEACDPTVANDCGSTLQCVASDTNHTGACRPFAHGQSVGKGYACGGSIGVGCATGLSCNAPTGVIGGTGTCN